MTPETWEDIRNNPTWVDCAEMRRIVADVIAYAKAALVGDMATAMKHRRLAMFCSLPGLGKSEMKKVFKRAGIQVGELNPANKVDLCYQLWQSVYDGCGVTAFDDVDLPTTSAPMIAILKRAWQSGGEGRVQPQGSAAIRKNEQYRLGPDERYDPAIPPPSFPFSLGHIWLTNKPLHTREGRVAEKCHPQFDALIDRGLAPMWIDSTPRNVCFYTIWMILHENLFRGLGLSLVQANETFEFFCDTATAGHPRPNLRLALDLARAAKRPDYREAWAAIVKQADVPDEPRALTPEDFKGKGRPDFLAEMKKLRERDAEAKRRADEAAAAVRHAEAMEAERRRRELEALAALDAEAETHRSPLPREELKRIVRTPTPPPPTLKPYTPPPGHVFPPPVVGTPYPEPKPYDVTVILDTPPAPEPTPPTSDPTPNPPPLSLAEEIYRRAADPPIAGQPDDLSKDIDATLLERLRARTGPIATHPIETPPPEPRPVRETSLLEQFNALRARRMARRQADVARQAAPTETPPSEPPPSNETSFVEKLQARQAAREAGETVVGGPYDARSTKPKPKPEPYEYSQNEPEDKLRKGKQTKQQIKRDRNRAEALRIVAGPRRSDEWGKVASRVKGDVVKYGWVRLLDYADAGMVPVLTDEGRERLELYEDDNPPDE